MASISRALERIKQDLGQLIPHLEVERICKDLNYQYRKRKLDPLTTIHLFVQQVLNYNTAITHLPRLSAMDFDPSAYCDARTRLPLKVLQTLLRKIANAMRDQYNTSGLWLGHRTWLVDGSSCSMPDTPALQAEFGQPPAQKKGCGFPVAHLLGMFDAYSGMLMEMVVCPLRTHDLSQVSLLHPLMQSGDVVVADRGLCSYVHLAMLFSRGIYAVFRVHQQTIVEFRQRPQKRRNTKPAKGEPRSRMVRKLGREDQIVQWYKPDKAPQWMEQAPQQLKEFDKLPESLKLRELRFCIRDKNCRTQVITLVTTLLDARKYSKSKLARLFKVRWRVEQDLKDLKTTLKMETLKCKTPDGVRKELAVYALVYNLVCLVREKGAAKQKVRPQRVSFIDVLRWLQVADPGQPLPRFRVNRLRPRRHEPRAVKRRPKEYDRLNKPRAEYKKAQQLPAKEA